MTRVRTFTIHRKNEGGFSIDFDSIFAQQELERLLEIYEKKLGPHKTLNIIPEFPYECGTPYAPGASYCQNGKVIALHCIATF